MRIPLRFKLPRFLLKGIIGGGVLASCWGAPRLMGDEYERLEAATTRWLALEEKIAAERNAWKSQKEILGQSVLVLKTDLEGLAQALASLEEGASARANDQVESAQSLDDEEAFRAYFLDFLERLTERLIRFRTMAPPALEDELRTALEKLEATEPGALGERAQTLVSTFTRVEEFNRSVSIDYVARKLEDGREVMVSVLYWGLARAYAADPEGTYAWELIPGEEGWVWAERPQHVAQIFELIQVYEQTRPPSLQAAPARIGNQAEGEG